MATSQRNTSEQTVLIFDNFYNSNLVVGAADYDVVYSYFFGTSKNSQIAGNFTALLFRIAQESAVNVLELLETIKGQQNKLQMNKVICYYLNALKSKTSLYGIGNVPKPNEAVQRNVVL
jgi:hypothetical protein